MTATITRPALRRVGKVRLWDIDPDLGSDAAVVSPSAVVLELPAGATNVSDACSGSRGALVLKGLLLRRVACAGGEIAELMGPGEIVSGTDPRAEALPVTSVRWRSVERTLIADLSSVEAGESRAELALLDGIARRLRGQAESASARCAMAALIRVDLRLLAYLWHLAGKFGHVTPAGVRLDLPLTHALLAQLIGARRPTVTTAFGSLDQAGFIHREGRSVVLVGNPDTAIERAGNERPAPRAARPPSVGS